MKQYETIVYNFLGGIISPGHLFDLLEIAEQAQVATVCFGSRQQLFMEVPVRFLDAFNTACRQKKLTVSTDGNKTGNLVSSYAANGIFLNGSWLSEGVYKELFDHFDYKPQLKINICHSDQTFVPFFTGHINWIAARQMHYWYLYIRLPHSNKIYKYPELIYTNNLVEVSRIVEQLLLEKTAMFYDDIKVYGDFLSHFISKTVQPITTPIEQELKLPAFHLPYYEGFNPQGNNWWLGIYRRNELFPVSFLKDICTTCLDTGIGELYATSWKSIIVKGINANDRTRWDQVLGRYRINVRHAANELNWQIEDNNEDGLVLKRHIIRYFDKEDVRTYGLCFAIKTEVGSATFGSVVIRRQPQKSSGRLKSQERYEIIYTPDFNPNAANYILFRNEVEKENLGIYLVSLCKLFYESSNSIPLRQNKKKVDEVVVEKQLSVVYKCSHCFTIYDQQAGEPTMGIAPGTGFHQLPEGYCCPLCEAPAEDFIVLHSHDLHIL